MKYFFLTIFAVAAIYFFTRTSPAPAPAQAAAAPAQSDFLKRPLDRTHEVLDQVRKNKSEEKF